MLSVALALVLTLVLVAGGCGGHAGGSPGTSASYARRVARIAERRCRRLGVAEIAHRLGVEASERAAVDAYASTWPVSVRKAARAGCLRGVQER